LDDTSDATWAIASPDLRPRPDSEVGWWFLQGRVALPDKSSVHVMVAFFQVHAQDGRDRADMLLLHALPSRPGAPPLVVSRVTPGLARMHETIAHRLAGHVLPGPLARLIVRRHTVVMSQRARLDGVETFDDHAEVAPIGLDIRWRDFALADAPDGSLTLTMPVDTEGTRLTLSLRPERPWMEDHGHRLDPRNQPDYAYLCCPRLSATGRLGDQPAQGTLWMDRQWGGFENWFFLRKRRQVRLVGWHWAGLSLDNGHDFLTWRRMVVGDRRQNDCYVVRFDDDGVAMIEGQLEPLAAPPWISPRSGIGYPLRHRLVLPELAGEIEIRPVIDDQEIPVFGVPSIWEGAVTARGRLEGQEVTGHGRLELYGHGYATSFGDYLRQQMRHRLRRRG
jgi:predicted secreted hydrolase